MLVLTWATGRQSTNMCAVSKKVSINWGKKYASFGQTDEERLEAEMRFFRGYLSATTQNNTSLPNSPRAGHL
ncbi:hypothetical protein NXW94_30060 [Bacteroides ovatus]|nr:hypothetical protein [Bacteroides ovatus]